MATSLAQPRVNSTDDLCLTANAVRRSGDDRSENEVCRATSAAEIAGFAHGPDTERVKGIPSIGENGPIHFEQVRALKIVVVEKEEELGAHVSAWQDLADHAIEANVFYEPWLLRPALANMHRGKPWRLVFIYETSSADSSKGVRLCGFFPLEPDTRFRILPVPFRAWRLLRHIHCFLCTPLIRDERAGETLAALLHWAGGNSGAHLLDFSHVRGDGPFQDLLNRYTRDTGAKQCLSKRYERALWKSGQGLETYLKDALSPGVRKEYRRQRRRLGELGHLEFRTLREERDLRRWLDEFLALEASGWKSREGQALGSNADERRFVSAAVEAGFSRGQTLLHGLFLNEKPVAMLLTFLAGSGGFAFKTAYDETFAKFSPGVQMMLDILHCLHSDSRFAWMDSCADPDHPMINRLWKDHKVIASMLISTGRRRGDLVIAIFPAGQRLIRVIRWIGKVAAPVKRCLGKLAPNSFPVPGVRPAATILHAQR